MEKIEYQPEFFCALRKIRISRQQGDGCQGFRPQMDLSGNDMVNRFQSPVRGENPQKTSRTGACSIKPVNPGTAGEEIVEDHT